VTACEAFVFCEECDASGRVPDYEREEMVDCPGCNGLGRRPCHDPATDYVNRRHLCDAHARWQVLPFPEEQAAMEAEGHPDERVVGSGEAD
jgi:hypothetical protein